MANVVWLPEALQDVMRSYEFRAERSPEVARRAAGRIADVARQLEHHPESGEPMDDGAHRQVFLHFGAGAHRDPLSLRQRGECRDRADGIGASSAKAETPHPPSHRLHHRHRIVAQRVEVPLAYAKSPRLFVHREDRIEDLVRHARPATRSSVRRNATLSSTHWRLRGDCGLKLSGPSRSSVVRRAIDALCGGIRDSPCRSRAARSRLAARLHASCAACEHFERSCAVWRRDASDAQSASSSDITSNISTRSLTVSCATNAPRSASG